MPPAAISNALDSARSKIDRLLASGFALSLNDRKIILYGQLFTTLTNPADAAGLCTLVDMELDLGEQPAPPRRYLAAQQVLFDQA